MATFDSGIFDVNIFDTADATLGVTAETLNPNKYPALMLSWSNDGGRSWVGNRQYSIGEEGYYRKRVKANRLGTAGIQGRVYKVEFSASRPFRLIGALADINVLRP